MKKGSLFLLIVLLILTLCGCVTTSDMTEMTPLNLYSKRKFSNQNELIFVGEGRSDTQRQAELLSYVDLNSKVYRYLGIVEEPESYKELTTNGTISAYNLKIEDKRSYESGGQYIYALVASANQELLDKDRSPDMQKEQEIAETAVNLVLQGDQCMMENHDIEGLKYYLKSMVYSYGLQYIEDEFSFSAILEEILNVLDVINIDISKQNEQDASCRLKITRGDTLIPSQVKYSEIKATFNSKDSRGDTYTDSFMYTTDERGIINFIPRAYNIANEGVIYFNFDFDEEIKAIEELSPFTAETIRSAVEKKRVSFEYKRITDTPVFALYVQCVDLQNSSSYSKTLAEYLKDKYAEFSVETFVFDYVEDETEEEMLLRFRKSYPDVRDILVLRVGTDSSFETQMGLCSVGVEGTIVVYNLDSGNTLYNSEVTYANGFGSSIEEAQETAFKNFILSMFTLLKAYYV